ncbi:hypothetical protein BJ170DRAFT_610431 [Xylariales sp. AK1849]|nr:hypothetical protein BJ170DRAFT_610431 [Xylariales sp. AK1849]
MRLSRNNLVIPCLLIPTIHAAAWTYVGCFYDSLGLTNLGPHIYQSRGRCQNRCDTIGQWVIGLTNGSDCLCGPRIPPMGSRVDEAECNRPCGGYIRDICGGWSSLSVWIKEPTIEEAGPSTASATQRPDVNIGAAQQIISQ